MTQHTPTNDLGGVLEVDEGVYHFPLPEGRGLQVKVTDEGVILDAFEYDEHVGTRAMTAAEWFRAIDEREPDVSPASEEVGPRHRIYGTWALTMFEMDGTAYESSEIALELIEAAIAKHVAAEDIQVAVTEYEDVEEA